MRAAPLTLAAAQALVPPLRACGLCRHGTPGSNGLLCAHPCVARGQGPLPVAQARALGGECGPGAEHLHVPSWDAAPDFSTTNRSTCD